MKYYSWNSINWHNPIRHFDPPEAGGEEIPLPTISFKIGSDDIVSFYFDLAITKEMGELKKFILKKSQKDDQEFKKIWRTIEKLSEPSLCKKGSKMGFNLS